MHNGPLRHEASVRRLSVKAAREADDDATLWLFTNVVEKYGWDWMDKYMVTKPNFIQGHLGQQRAGYRPIFSYKVVNGYQGFLVNETQVVQLRKRFEAFTGPVVNAGGVR